MNISTGGATQPVASRQVQQQPLVWSLAPIAISVFLLAALTAFRLRGGATDDVGVLSAPVVGFYWLLGFEPAFMFSLLVLAWSSIWFLTGTMERPWARIGKILALTLCLAILVNLRSNGTLPEHGGWIGGFFAQRLYSVFGFMLSTLAVTVAALVLLFKATDSFFIRYFEGLGRMRSATAPDAGVETQAVDELQSLQLGAAAAVPDARPQESRARVASGGVRILGPEEPREERRSRYRAEPEAEPEPEPTPESRILARFGERDDEFGSEIDDVDTSDRVDVDAGAEDEFELAVAAVEEAGLHTQDDDVDELLEREADEELVGTPVDFDEPDEEFDDAEEDFVSFRIAESPVQRPSTEQEDEVVDYAAAIEAQAPEAGAPEAGAPEAGAPEAGAPEAEERTEAHIHALAEDAAPDDIFVFVEDEVVEPQGFDAPADELDEPDAASLPDQPVVELPAVPPAAPASAASRQGALFGSPAGDPELIDQAAVLVIEYRRASANFLRRRLRITNDEAVDVLGVLSERGVVECEPGAGHGRVIMELETWQERSG